MFTETIRLTSTQRRFLEILSGSQDWMNRTQLAEAYGRSLGQHDFDSLGKLAEAGMIQAEKRRIGIVKEEWAYRAL